MSMRLPVMRVRAYIPRAAIALCLSMSGVLLWSTVAQGATDHGLFSAFGTFTGAVGVAVDDSTGASKGDLYVVDQGGGKVDRFTAAEAANNEAGRQLTGVTLVAPSGVAVDDSGSASTGDVYVTEPAEGVIDKFNGATGAYEAQLDGREAPHAGSFEPVGVGVDPANGDVFVTDAHNGVVDVFTAAGKYSTQFGAGLPTSPTGVAVNGAGDAYVSTAGGEAFEFLAEGEYTSLLPVGVGVSTVGVDPASGDVYLDQGSSIEELGSGGESLGSFGAGVLAGSAGVGIDGVTGTAYASNGASAAIFTVGETPKEPAITGTPVEVTSSTATFKGKLAGGEKGYYFAYNSGPSCTGAGDSEPGAATGNAEVSTAVGGLLPATQYTVCLVATNPYGATLGPVVSFETNSVPPAVEGVAFSDVGSGSAMVSGQVDPNGTLTEYDFEYGTSFAYGSATTVVSAGAGQQPVTIQTALNGLTPGSEYHFRLVARNANGEATDGSDITFRTLPASILGLPDGRVYERVSPAENENADVYVPNVFDATFLPLSEGIFTRHPFEASVNGDAVLYAGDPTSGGTGQGGQNSGNEYLATRSPAGVWNQINITPPGRFSARYQGFASDLSVGVLSASSITGFEAGAPPLSPEAPEGYTDLYSHLNSGGSYQPFLTKSPDLHRSAEEFKVEYAGASANFGQVFFEANDALTSNAVFGVAHGYNLYDSVGGQLGLVNVLPSGATSGQHAIFGAPSLSGESGIGLAIHDNPPDFSHVVSTDGSRVFWTNLEVAEGAPGQLTGERILGLYARENPSQPQSPLESDGACAVSSDACTVQVDAAVGGGGRFWTATPDGSKVFFTKGNLYEYDLENGQITDLTPGVEVDGVVGTSENGEYVYYFDSNNHLDLWHQGSSRLIATLSNEDREQVPPYRRNQEEEFGDLQAGLGRRTAEVSADGSAVVFMSSQELRAEGYPNGYPNSGLEEVYVYEAEGNHLFCVSCSPSGERPPSEVYNEAAAFLPVSWSTTYMPNWLSEEGGRVFFDSGEPLVPQDTNGKLDVYEWERDGTGSCGERDGCIYLLSGGTSGSSSWLLGASESGNDTFIISRAPLVPGSPYDSFDLYDARAGGVQQPAPPACSGTGCQGVPPAPPIFATPSSVTFNGVGNFPATQSVAAAGKRQLEPKRLTRAQKLVRALKACKNHQGRTRCERQARKRYAVHSRAGRPATHGKGR
jgi:hypothetical protein